MNPWSSLLQKVAALVGGMVNATALDLDTIVLESFNALQQSSRNVRPAHLSDAFDLWSAEDWHDARYDGDRDSNSATPLDKPKVVDIVKKKLRYEKLGARINFSLEIVQVNIRVRRLRMFFGICRGSDT